MRQKISGDGLLRHFWIFFEFRCLQAAIQGWPAASSEAVPGVSPLGRAKAASNSTCESKQCLKYRHSAVQKRPVAPIQMRANERCRYLLFGCPYVGHHRFSSLIYGETRKARGIAAVGDCAVKLILSPASLDFGSDSSVRPDS